MSDPNTIRVYDARAGEYAQITGSDTPDAALQAFIDALPSGAQVLDLGCGPGAAAGNMARAGHMVQAWDASHEMVALAARHPGVRAAHKEFDDLAQLAPESLDGVWANFSLLHADAADMPGHLSAIKSALRPGGLFHIAVKEGHGTHRDPIGRFYTYYMVESLSDLLRAEGLEPGPFRKGRDRGLDGRVAPWISTTAHA